MTFLYCYEIQLKLKGILLRLPLHYHIRLSQPLQIQSRNNFTLVVANVVRVLLGYSGDQHRRHLLCHRNFDNGAYSRMF